MKNIVFIMLIVILYGHAQNISVLTSGFKSSLRGLSVVDEKTIWASGSNGTVARSVDGGISWKWLTVKGFEKTDFRDIEAFDSATAIIMAIGEPALIFKTTDAGVTWKIVYENKTKAMFLDAMDFYGKKNGVVVGDPIQHRFFIARTYDGGDTWTETATQNQPAADSGEACFASSGTNIKLSAKGKIYFVSGGLRSRLIDESTSIILPILQGRESTGANSLAIKNRKTFIVAGGDFNVPDSLLKNCTVTYTKGKTWSQPAIAPHGYRSCVEHINRNNWVMCGLNGVDYSDDNGKTWQWISKEGFHVCRKAKKGNAVFLAGAGGRIGKMNLL